MNRNKDLRKLIRDAEAAGWRLIRSKKHLVFRHPVHGQQCCPHSPSDHRSLMNARKKMKI